MSEFNYVDEHGNTPLMIMAMNDDTEEAIDLLTNYSRNIDPGRTNDEGNTALIIACLNENEDLAIALLKTHRSNPDQINNAGKTALEIACEKKMTAFIVELISHNYLRETEIIKLNDLEFGDNKIVNYREKVRMGLCKIEDCKFEDFEFEFVDFKNGSFENVEFINVMFELTEFDHASFGSTILSENDDPPVLKTVLFNNVKLYSDVSFKNASFRNASFQNITFVNDTEFNNSRFINCTFTGSFDCADGVSINFTNSYFENVSFDVEFNFQVIPDFTNAVFVNCYCVDPTPWRNLGLDADQLEGLGIEDVDLNIGNNVIQENHGIAFEVHNKFDIYKNRLADFFEIIKTKQKSVVPLKIIEAFFIKFINTHFRQEEKETLIEQLKVVLQIYGGSEYSNDPTVRKYVSLIYRFVKEQPDEFIDFYIRAFIQDCYFAYPGEPGRGVSCPNGIIEKFMLILHQTTTALCPGNECDNETYKKLNNYFNNKIDKEFFNEFAQYFEKRFFKPEQFKEQTPEEWKEHFIKILKRRIVEKGYKIDDEIEKQINDYVNEISYAFETGQFGGRRKIKDEKRTTKRTTKKRQNPKRLTPKKMKPNKRSTYKKQQEKRKAPRKQNSKRRRTHKK